MFIKYKWFQGDGESKAHYEIIDSGFTKMLTVPMPMPYSMDKFVESFIIEFLNIYENDSKNLIYLLKFLQTTIQPSSTAKFIQVIINKFPKHYSDIDKYMVLL